MWNWSRYVMIPMTTLIVGMIGAACHFYVTELTDILNSTAYYHIDPGEHWPCMVQHQHCPHLLIYRCGVHPDVYHSRDESSTRHARPDEANYGEIL